MRPDVLVVVSPQSRPVVKSIKLVRATAALASFLRSAKAKRHIAENMRLKKYTPVPSANMMGRPRCCAAVRVL